VNLGAEGPAHGTDPLRLAVVFGLDELIAIRDGASARQVLGRAHEADLVAWPPTQGSLDGNASDEHSGSR
jgi:hypothetical protein